MRLPVIHSTHEDAQREAPSERTLPGVDPPEIGLQHALVISEIEIRGLQVRQKLQAHGCECLRDNVVPFNQAVQRLLETNPDLVVVLLSPSPEQALNVLAELRTLTASRILAVGRADDPRLILRTLRSGADEYLDEQHCDTEIDSTVHNRKSGQTRSLRLGSAIAVLAPSGGAGASTVAVNLAVALARTTPPTLLVDLHTQAGDLAAMFDVRPAFSWYDLCSKGTQVDPALLQRTLITHSSGVSLLASPRELVGLASPSADQTRQIVTLGRGLFAHVILDLDRSYGPDQMQALRLADIVLLVFRLDFCSLKNVRQSLALLERNGIPAQRVRLVVNQQGQPHEITPSQAQEALGTPLAHLLPSDPHATNRALNSGVPVILDSPKTKIARALCQIAQSLPASRQG